MDEPIKMCPYYDRSRMVFRTNVDMISNVICSYTLKPSHQILSFFLSFVLSGFYFYLFMNIRLFAKYVYYIINVCKRRAEANVLCFGKASKWRVKITISHTQVYMVNGDLERNRNRERESEWEKNSTSKGWELYVCSSNLVGSTVLFLLSFRSLSIAQPLCEPKKTIRFYFLSYSFRSFCFFRLVNVSIKE